MSAWPIPIGEAGIARRHAWHRQAARKSMHPKRSAAMMRRVPIPDGDSRRGGGMRRIASILAVMVIAAALAPGAEAGEKIRLAQSSTVTNCMMTCNSQVAN
jgi:hypothetical protein